MAQLEIARGLQTLENDPSVCYHCLHPNHIATQCPLNRRRINIAKYSKKLNLKYGAVSGKQNKKIKTFL